VTETYVMQKRCVYCDEIVRPMAYDHFIPKCIVHAIRAELPIRINNWLVPACRVCNNVAGSYFFQKFAQRWEFVKSRTRGGTWDFYANQTNEVLYNICVTDDILMMIVPINQMTTLDKYVIIWPVFENGAWDVSQAREHFVETGRYRGRGI